MDKYITVDSDNWISKYIPENSILTLITNDSSGYRWYVFESFVFIPTITLLELKSVIYKTILDSCYINHELFTYPLHLRKLIDSFPYDNKTIMNLIDEKKIVDLFMENKYEFKIIAFNSLTNELLIKHECDI